MLRPPCGPFALSQQFLRADESLHQTQKFHLDTQEDATGGGTLRPHFVISANETAAFLCSEMLLSATFIL